MSAPFYKSVLARVSAFCAVAYTLCLQESNGFVGDCGDSRESSGNNCKEAIDLSLKTSSMTSSDINMVNALSLRRRRRTYNPISITGPYGDNGDNGDNPNDFSVENPNDFSDNLSGYHMDQRARARQRLSSQYQSINVEQQQQQQQEQRARQPQTEFRVSLRSLSLGQRPTQSSEKSENREVVEKSENREVGEKAADGEAVGKVVEKGERLSKSEKNDGPDSSPIHLSQMMVEEEKSGEEIRQPESEVNPPVEEEEGEEQSAEHPAQPADGKQENRRRAEERGDDEAGEGDLDENLSHEEFCCICYEKHDENSRSLPCHDKHQLHDVAECLGPYRTQQREGRILPRCPMCKEEFYFADVEGAADPEGGEIVGGVAVLRANPQGLFNI
jgi:hypothetical protein